MKPIVPILWLLLALLLNFGAATAEVTGEVTEDPAWGEASIEDSPVLPSDAMLIQTRIEGDLSVLFQGVSLSSPAGDDTLSQSVLLPFVIPFAVHNGGDLAGIRAELRAAVIDRGTSVARLYISMGEDESVFATSNLAPPPVHDVRQTDVAMTLFDGRWRTPDSDAPWKGEAVVLVLIEIIKSDPQSEIMIVLESLDLTLVR